MKFIRPTKITDAMLTSSTVAEADYTAWDAATSYSVGDRVTRAVSGVHKNFENMTAGIDATLPELAPTRWLDLGATNRWAMFDGVVGTVSTDTPSITVVLAPGRINSLALLQIDAATVTVDLTVDSVSVYSASMNLSDGTVVGDWYQYFYEPVYEQDAVVIVDLVDASLIDLPAYSAGILTVTISRPAGSVSLGALIVGMYANLGETKYQPKISIVDYSRKDVDVFGNYTVVKRAYSKRMNAQVEVLKAYIDIVSRLLAQYRSTPLVWIGAGNIYTSMIIYGFYRDWEISIDNNYAGDLSLQVEGLT